MANENKAVFNAKYGCHVSLYKIVFPLQCISIVNYVHIMELLCENYYYAYKVISLSLL